jgi:hypothetical protein
LIAQRVVLSTKLGPAEPQVSLPPVAAGIVIPGVHDADVATGPQVEPTPPPECAQFDPLQQRLGSGAL